MNNGARAQHPAQDCTGKKAERHREYVRAFRLSAAAGATFGLVFALVLLRQGVSPWAPSVFAAGLVLLIGMSAGLAGMAAVYLDAVLQRRGMAGGLARTAVSFAVVAVAAVLVFYGGAVLLGIAPPAEEAGRLALWGGLAALTFGAVFALLGYWAGETRQRIRLLELKNRHLAELASREKLLREAARNLAVAEERNRMARDIHDSVSQGLHSIVYALRSLRGVTDNGDERVRRILDHLERTSGETLRELRRLVDELSPSPLEDRGLAEGLRLQAELLALRHGVRVETHLDYDGGLQPEQEVALYRIAQEALANVQRHADADKVELRLERGEDAVTLTIADDGVGGAVPVTASAPHGARRRHGLANMAARARQNGGNFHISSPPGQGTTINIALPAGTPRCNN